jgi:hypothetical protein
MHAWQTSANRWCALKGVDVPHACEISPAQYGLLSKRAKAEYDHKRTQEWDVTAAAKAEWQRLVLAAYAAGEPDETASQEARAFYASALREQAKVRAQSELRARRDANDLAISDCRAGDRVFSHSTGYAVITRVNRVSISVTTEGGRKMVIRAGAVMRRAPSEIT